MSLLKFAIYETNQDGIVQENTFPIGVAKIEGTGHPLQDQFNAKSQILTHRNEKEFGFYEAELIRNDEISVKIAELQKFIDFWAKALK